MTRFSTLMFFIASNLQILLLHTVAKSETKYTPAKSFLRFIRIDEAQEYLRELMNLDPSFSIKRVEDTYPFRRDSDKQDYIEGLRLAGVQD